MDFGGNASNNFDLSSINSDIIPSTDDLYSVGSDAKRFKSAHFCEGDFKPNANSTTSFRIERKVSGPQEPMMFNVNSSGNIVDVGNESSTVNIGDVGSTINIAGSSYPSTSSFVDNETSGSHGIVVVDGTVPGNSVLRGTSVAFVTVDGSDKQLTCAAGFNVKNSAGNLNVLTVDDNGLFVRVNIMPSLFTSPNLGDASQRFQTLYCNDINSDFLSTSGSYIYIAKSIVPSITDNYTLGTSSHRFNALHTEDIICYNNLGQSFCAINGFPNESTLHLQALNNEEKFLVKSVTNQNVFQVNTVDPGVVVRGNFSQTQGTTTINGNATFTANATFEDYVSMPGIACYDDGRVELSGLVDVYGGFRFGVSQKNAILLEYVSSTVQGIILNGPTTLSGNHVCSFWIDATNAGGASVPEPNGMFMAKGTSVNGNFLTFYADNASRGSITWNGSVVQYLTTSDRNLKKNIEDDDDDDLSKIMDIKCRKFRWKDEDDSKIKTKGLIAQEVRDVFPDVVDIVSSDENVLGIDYGKMTPKLVNALQQQQKMIRKMNRTIKNLEDRISVLEK